MQQFCRHKSAAMSAVSPGAAFVGRRAMVNTLIRYAGIEQPCGLWADGYRKTRATGDVVTQQNCAR